MGLLIQVSFETPEGLAVTSVYSKITGIVCDFLSHTQLRVLVKHETYLSRERRFAGARAIQVPEMPGYFIFYTSSSESTWATMENLYAKVKADIESRGYTVENVDPDPPLPEPELAPAPAPSSRTPAMELAFAPAPAPSSE